MSDIEDITDMEFGELLQQVHLGELDVVDSHIHEELDMSEELLGVQSSRLQRMIRKYIGNDMGGVKNCVCSWYSPYHLRN